MAGAGDNIKNWIPKWMDWEVYITVVQTTKIVFDSVKLNQATVEKWMLYQAADELLELYFSMSKGMVPEVVKKHTEAIYFTHGQDYREVRHFFQYPRNACLEILESVCLYLLPLLKPFWVQEGKGAPILFFFSGSTFLPDEKCSRVSRSVWKESRVYKWIEVSLHWLFLPDNFEFETMWYRGSPLIQRPN